MEETLSRIGLGSQRSSRGRTLPSEPGQRKALFLELVRESESTLVRVARRLCHRRDDADDVVQGAIVSAYRAFMAGKFEDLHNFRPWMLVILRNTFLQMQRTAQRWVLTDSEALEALQAPDRVAPTLEIEHDLERALQALTDDQRLCVQLVYFEELEYAEAAAVLQIPIGTVRSRLARARYAMVETLGEVERSRSTP